MPIFEDYLRSQHITASSSSIEDHVRAAREVFTWRFPRDAAANIYRQKAVKKVDANLQTWVHANRFTAQSRRSFIDAVEECLQEAAAALDPPPPRAVDYPFPTEPIPRYVYRWCSRDEGQTAQRVGIVKTGDVHSGIPTLGAVLTRQQAERGGGMGIVNTDVHLQIDTQAIPEIRNRQPNSINRAPSRSGHPEWKILVTIPPEAIQRL